MSPKKTPDNKSRNNNNKKSSNKKSGTKKTTPEKPIDVFTDEIESDVIMEESSLSEQSSPAKEKETDSRRTFNIELNLESAEGQDKETENGQEEDVWTPNQVKSLLAAHRKVDPNTPLFWKEVAKLVKGKNAAQCRKKFEDRFKTPSSKSKKTKKATKELSPINLGANKKTAKFKQKVRQFVQRTAEADDSHRDAFESTPFKNRYGNINSVDLSGDAEMTENNTNVNNVSAADEMAVEHNEANNGDNVDESQAEAMDAEPTTAVSNNTNVNNTNEVPLSQSQARDLIDDAIENIDTNTLGVDKTFVLDNLLSFGDDNDDILMKPADRNNLDPYINRVSKSMRGVRSLESEETNKSKKKSSSNKSKSKTHNETRQLLQEMESDRNRRREKEDDREAGESEDDYFSEDEDK
jgi:hypothetical protein